jgi:hypothetical protein
MIQTRRPHVVEVDAHRAAIERARLFLRDRVVPVLVALCFAAVGYMAVLRYEPGWVTFGLSCSALTIVFVTAVVRLNSIRPEDTTLSWQVRRVALIMVAGASVTVGIAPIMGPPDWPTWGEVALRWGFALTWITTPNMPPWWRFILFHEEFIERRRSLRGPPK